MAALARGLVGLVGLFMLFMGARFLISPAEMGAQFFLAPQGAQGLASIRADFTGFFLGVGFFALYGAWKERRDALLVPLFLLIVAIIGRIVGIIADGITPTTFAPMIGEAIMIAILAFGYKVLREAA